MIALWRWLIARPLDLGYLEWSEHRARRQARVTAQYLGLPPTDEREIYQPATARPDHRAFWAALERPVSKPARVLKMRSR